MLRKSIELRKAIRAATSTREQLNLVRRAYAGEDAYIISCGPSTAEAWSPIIESFLSDKLVIAIKQAFDLAPDIYDFHIINNVHEKSYKQTNSTVRISTTSTANLCDLHLPTPRSNTYNRCLAVTRDYDRWTLDQSHNRPWGVGVMHEVGIFLPVHLGCRSLTVLGWDLCGSHFYEAKKSTPSYETLLIVESAPSLAAWMHDSGCPIRLYSPQSRIPIQQISLCTFLAGKLG
jgi:hypothetical protein